LLHQFRPIALVVLQAGKRAAKEKRAANGRRVRSCGLGELTQARWRFSQFDRIVAKSISASRPA
jgi:hypothetical protein